MRWKEIVFLWRDVDLSRRWMAFLEKVCLGVDVWLYFCHKPELIFLCIIWGGFRARYWPCIPPSCILHSQGVVRCLLAPASNDSPNCLRWHRGDAQRCWTRMSGDHVRCFFSDYRAGRHYVCWTRGSARRFGNLHFCVRSYRVFWDVLLLFEVDLPLPPTGYYVHWRCSLMNAICSSWFDVGML